MSTITIETLHPVLNIRARSSEEPVKVTSTSQTSRSPPKADFLLHMARSCALEDDYFERRVLRTMCIQPLPLPDDFHPQASEIIPGLFLCDLYTATSPVVLAYLGITHVASITKEVDPRCPPSIKQMCIPVDDVPSTNLLKYFDPAITWISDALRDDGRVLVHCVWGMSRSATVMIAYLIKTKGISLEEAFRMVKSKRQVIRPNDGFLEQLKAYEKVSRLREAHAKSTVRSSQSQI